jgi:hypothetical protein
MTVRKRRDNTVSMVISEAKLFALKGQFRLKIANSQWKKLNDNYRVPSSR